MSFFGNALGGNPFSTPVGGKIEQATDGTLASENWGLNIEICDLVNETEDGPRDAVKAIRKRLQQNAGKNYTVVMYTLTVLETCVKNCGKRFHILICNKDFVLELVKLIGPKNDPPTAVQEKVLSLIQSWADAFRNQPEMAGVVSVYQDLLAKGIEFPATDLDAMAPIHTPQRSVESELPIPIEAQPQQSSPVHVSTPTGGTLTPEQRAKLQSELDIVQNNMGVFSELLSELKPGYEQPDELELLQELHVTCQSMQERLVELISKLSNDELTAEFLRINDDLNNLFLRYNRWEKNHENGGGIGIGGSSKCGGIGKSASEMLAKAIIPPPPPQQQQQQQTKQKLTNDDSLISFDEDSQQNIDDLSLKLSELGTGSTSASNQLSKIENVPTKNTVNNKNDEFDMFAQSRNVSYENSKTSGSTYKDNLESDQLIGGLNTATQAKQTNPPDLEFDEMANWLGQTTGGEQSLTSSEFERFLAERAAAAEQLPTVTGSTNDSSSSRKNPSKDETKGLYAS